MTEEILYTPEELAQKLKLSKYTVYEMIKKGTIQAHRMGRSLRITESQLNIYLQQTKQSDNIYSAEIIEQNGETFAKLTDSDHDVLICVSTETRGKAKIKIKPEDVIIARQKIICSARNQLAGTIIDIEEAKGGCNLIIDIGVVLSVAITKRSIEEMDLNPGDEVFAIFKTMAVLVA